MPDTKLCNCPINDDTSWELLAVIDRAPLPNGYTAFYLFKCLACRGFTSNAKYNLELAIKGGMWKIAEEFLTDEN